MQRREKDDIYLSMAEVSLHLLADVDDLPRRGDHEKETSTADQLLFRDLKEKRKHGSRVPFVAAVAVYRTIRERVVVMVYSRRRNIAPDRTR